MEKSDKIVSKYLEAVDRYDRAQKTLNEGIQNGFLELARANYSSRIKYGKDQYDERVRAGKIIKYKDDNNNNELTLESTDEPDPIKMFGILVPMPLRDSKKSFSAALEGMIAVINAKQELEQLEHELKETDVNK